MSAKNYHYFSSFEANTLKKFTKFRTAALTPLLKILTTLHISANHISLLSLLLIIVFPLLFLSHPSAAITLLVTHLLLDGVDGPLARFQYKDSRAGALTDIIVDHSAFAIVTFSLIYFAMIPLLWGLLYLCSYIFVIAFSIFLNTHGIRPIWVLKSKYILYLSLVLQVFLNINFLEPFALIATIYNLLNIPVLFFQFFGKKL